MKVKQVFLIMLIAVTSAAITVTTIKMFEPQQAEVSNNYQPAALTKYIPPPMAINSAQPVDFTSAATKTTPAVVHIKTLSTKQVNNSMSPMQDDLFRWFYGESERRQQPRESRSSGSGVIISNDGYIVTNNHVVENADEIEVTLHNNETLKGELIGVDKDTDLALVRVNSEDMEFLDFANSDQVQVGEWVLAVGNPFNLASTVTAGIVSAKSRNIDILRNYSGTGNTAVESFIQTDAAVNPGNSGGALVNINGELIGINTAIATPTGTFAGYSFAVPSNLVRKVISDLREFGTVQRGFLGVNIRSLDEDVKDKLDLDFSEGVVLMDVLDGGAAEEAGLKKNDVITQINDREVKSSSELQEMVARYRPGDDIAVRFFRDGKTKLVNVTLKNRYNETSFIDDDQFLEELLGAEVEVVDISGTQRGRMGIRGTKGLKVESLRDGKLKSYTNIKEGFIITHMNEIRVENKQEAVKILKEAKGNVTVEGVLPNKQYAYLYAFKMEE